MKIALIACSSAILICGLYISLRTPSPNPQPAKLASQEDDFKQKSIGAAAPVAASTGDDWPRLFGPTGDCRTAEFAIETDWPSQNPPLLWKKQIGTGYSAPIVFQQKLILQHRIENRELVDCLNTNSGEQIWSAETPTDFKCEYSSYSSGPYSTPSTDGQYIYTLTATGELRCLNFSDGTPVWTRQLTHDFNVPALGYAAGHSPLIEGELLMLNVCGTTSKSGIVALNRFTGETVWQALNTESSARYGSLATPVVGIIHNQRLLFVLSAAEFVCLRPETGAILWTVPVGTGSADTPNSTTPLVSGEYVLVSAFRADTFCLKILTDGSYEEVWRNRRSLESVFNPLTAMGGVVFGWHSFDKTFRCIDLSTGNVRWKEKTVFERGNQIATRNFLMLWGERGHFGIIHCNPDQFQPVRICDAPLLAPPCYTSPAWSAGRLFLRNESELICVDLRKTTDE